VDAPHKRYSNATAERVICTYRDLERIDDVVTISAIARRAGVRRSTVRAVLRQECGWPGLMAAHGKLASTGYLHLTQGRENLAARGWPNWKKAQTVLESQDYLPLLDAQRLRTNSTPLPLTDRRVLRGRTTRLAVLDAFQQLRSRQPEESARDTDRAGRRSGHRISARMVAETLQLHPTTVYGHLKQLRAQGIVE
jgi:hypothetical protein